MQWFIMRNGQQAGPYTVEQIRAMLGTLELAPTDMAWREGMAGWSPISTVLATSPPPPPSAAPPPPPFANAPPSYAGVPAAAPGRPGAQKSRIAYVVLAIALGWLGIHNFYAGYVGRGVAQLLLTVLTLGLLFWAVWIWAVIEAIAITKDGTGVAFN